MPRVADGMPKSLVDNPRLDRWLGFDTPGRVQLRVGKVELGQGIATALCQIAAEELDVALSQLDLLAGDTDHAPDEGTTTSSLSIEVGGAALRLVCAETRMLFLREAARRLNCAPDALAVEDGAVWMGDAATGLDYWSLPVSLARDASGAVAPKPVGAHRLVGRSVPRRDLPTKIFGAGFVQDYAPAGLRHGHVVHAPRSGGRVAGVDEAAIHRAAGGALEIIRHGTMIALLADDATILRRAAFAADQAVRWDGLLPLEAAQQEAAWLLEQPSREGAFGDPAGDRPPTLTATYSRPYIAHASIGPSCAVAAFQDGHLTVWCAAQGVYGLKATLAGGLKLRPDQVSVRHMHGSGCYGQNGADDAAFDAAAIALLRPARPIRVRRRR